MQSSCTELMFNLRWSPVVPNSPNRKSIKIINGKLILFVNEKETIKEDKLLIDKIYKIIINSLNNLVKIASEQTKEYLMNYGLDGGAPYLLDMEMGGLSLKITSQVKAKEAHIELQTLYEEIEKTINNE